MPIDPEFLAILACPLCHSPLEPASFRDASAEEALRCAGCGRVYPVRDGIPDILVTSAWMPGGKAS